jgi:hypothetical protein
MSTVVVFAPSSDTAVGPTTTYFTLSGVELGQEAPFTFGQDSGNDS